MILNSKWQYSLNLVITPLLLCFIFLLSGCESSSVTVNENDQDKEIIENPTITSTVTVVPTSTATAIMTAVPTPTTTVTYEPTVSLSISETNINTGESVALTWSSEHTTSCNASGAWSGDLALSGSQNSAVFNQAGHYEFVLTCQGDGGSAVLSVQLEVLEVVSEVEFSRSFSALNDTGITFGANETNNGPDCSTTVTTSSGLALLQDCSQGRSENASDDNDGVSGFHFSRINADGSAYTGSGNFNSSPWACVYDHRTGLLWEVKSNDGSVHDADHRYRWGGLTAQGREHVERLGDYYDDWNALVIQSNEAEFCGYSDWQVPSMTDLMSLVHFGAVSSPFSVKIDQDYFPNANDDNYWSSTPFGRDPFYAWTQQLGLGNNKNIQRYIDANVRLVRVID